METQSAPLAKENTLSSVILPAIRNFIIGVLAFGAILCLLAGTLYYWRGCFFIVLFAALNTSQGIYLALKDPELLKRRQNVAPKEESTAQRVFIVVALLALASTLIVSALDHRFGWSQMSVLVSLLGDGLLVFSYYLYYLVFKQNSYAASSIQTFEGQKVISTGLYGIVRHPKYLGDLFLTVGIPLALGSWWALLFILITLPGLVWRIFDEEKLLQKDLPGYADYMQKVKFRLVPYLW